MSGWSEVELGEHVELTVGFPFKSANYLETGRDGVRLLRGDNVGQGSLRWEGVKNWPAGEAELYASYQLAEDDVILAMDRPWIEAGLKFAYVRKSDLPCLLVQRVARLRGSPTLDIKFLRYVIGSQAFTAHVKSITTGVNIPHISGRDIKRFRLPLPSIDEQRRIASILAAYDDLIEVNRRRIEALEALARDLFEEWFVRFRFPGHETVPIADTAIGPRPSGWEIGTVTRWAHVQRGRSYRSDELVHSGRPFVNLKCMRRDGGFRRDGIKGFQGEVKPRHLLSAGDIVIAVTDMTQERRIVAQAARIPPLVDQAVFSMDLVKLEPHQLEHRAFFYAFWRWSGCADQLRHHANGANVLHLAAERISSFEMAFPGGSLAAMFAKSTEPLFELADTIEQTCDHLQAARNHLLPRLISGDLSIAAATFELEAVA